MTEIVLLLWILIWVILIFLSIIETRGITFGAMSGIWLLLLGVYIYIDGIQVQSGMTIVTSGSTQTITYSYSDIILPVSNYGLLWGIPFVLIAIYILYLSATARNKKQ